METSEIYTATHLHNFFSLSLLVTLRNLIVMQVCASAGGLKVRHCLHDYKCKYAFLFQRVKIHRFPSIALVIHVWCIYGHASDYCFTFRQIFHNGGLICHHTYFIMMPLYDLNT